MNRDTVLKWAREADLRLRCASDSMEAIHHFARLVRNAALDEAAAMCRDQFPKYYGGNMAAFRQCAIAIESLKEPQP